jgi:hypothetical protein
MGLVEAVKLFMELFFEKNVWLLQDWIRLCSVVPSRQIPDIEKSYGDRFPGSVGTRIDHIFSVPGNNTVISQRTLH